jgi:hypothetical protein
VYLTFFSNLFNIIGTTSECVTLVQSLRHIRTKSVYHFAHTNTTKVMYECSKTQHCMQHRQNISKTALIIVHGDTTMHDLRSSTINPPRWEINFELASMADKLHFYRKASELKIHVAQESSDQLKGRCGCRYCSLQG